MIEVKKTKLKLLICVLIALAFGCIAVGCNGENIKGHYDHLVTFNYNFGNMDANCPDQYLGVLDNSLIAIQPGYSDKFSEYTVNGYFIEGWYTAKADIEGNPIIGDDNVVELDRKWDFKTQRVTEDITLYANLVRKPVLSIIDRGSGKVLSEIESLPGAKRDRPTLDPQKEGYSFTGVYYAESTGEREFVWPYTFGTENEEVYVEFIEGEWTVVNTVAEFNRAIGQNKNIYLAKDLDYSNSAWVMRSFNGTINGNGHKISGITMTITPDKTTKVYAGVFNVLREKANIYDVTFENVDVTYNSNSTAVGISVALFASEIRDGAQMSNVTISGTLRYKSYGGAVEGYALAVINDSQQITDCDYSQVIIEES